MSAGQGFTFDANGNLIVDADGRQFTFNGDNKQTEVKDAQNNVIGQYRYDGEGKRIKKETATETTIFVYSAGKLIAEYSTATPPSNPATRWTVTDQLGSPRVIVNSLGQVVSRRDFMPFGEELAADETYRKTLDKYGQTDSVRQKFTGYHKDEETGLDFAENRMYQNLHGRFTAVDPLLASGKSANPQTFNRYVYVINNPLLYTDPDGLQIASCPPGVPGTGCAVVEEVIRVFTILFTDRNDFLLGRATNISHFDALNFERAQNHINAMRGDPVAAEALNRRILGNRGPTVDSVMQQTVDSYRAAEEIGNAGIAANLVLLGVPVPGASNSVTTNIGPSAPRSPLAGSIRNVNPSGGTQNCVDCAIATDATLAGRPTIAAASGPRRISVIEKEFGESFVPMTRSEITNHMTTAGSGARGIVFAEGSEQNHAFNVVNQNGTIRFLDGQTGRAVDWQRSWKNFMFLRTNAQ